MPQPAVHDFRRGESELKSCNDQGSQAPCDWPNPRAGRLNGVDRLSKKESGAFYTPANIAAALVRWVVREAADRMLDPSCGDGRFIAQHANSVGIERDLSAAAIAAERAPEARVYNEDFFDWAGHTTQRFECAAGNPPFIRYQAFKGERRERALTLCRRLGARFSGLTSSWAPFLVATAGLLLPGGRMAFVVPAEIGHAPYAAPLLEYLVSHFALVHLVAIREKLFPELSEDCWLLYAEGFGEAAAGIEFSAVENYLPSRWRPLPELCIPLSEWRAVWKRRLRPFILPGPSRALYRDIVLRSDTRRIRDLANVGIGYVSGANEFFHMRPSDAARWDIPSILLHPTVRNGRALPARRLSRRTVENWQRADEPVLLLRIPNHTVALPSAVRRYLDTEQGRLAREAYKCRMREPWYSVPDVQVPDYFLTYLSGRGASLVRNDAGCTCTNSVHSVRIKDEAAVPHLLRSWNTPFVRLSCEIEGHPLGGGLLKLEPREAEAIAIPSTAAAATASRRVLLEGLATMHAWRHYGKSG